MVTWIRTIRLSFKSLLLHPLRSALTVLGIFIGVSSVIWLLAIGEGIGRAAEEQIISLGARNVIVRTVKPTADEAQDSGYGLTRADFRRLASSINTGDEELIDTIVPIREVAREFRYYTRVMEGRLVGSTPDYAEMTRLEIHEGRFFTQTDIAKERNYCVLAWQVAETLFPTGDALGKKIMVDDDFYEVIGVTKERGQSAGIGGSIAAEDYSKDVYVPIDTLWRRVGDMIVVLKPGQFQRDIVELSQITLRVKDRDLVLPTADLIRNTVQYSHTLPDFSVVVPMELLKQAQTTRLLFVLFLGLIAAISLVVGGIGIMNIMLASVIERTREIGIRRALGAKRRDITRQFLIESIVLSAVGGILGIVAGFACGPIIIQSRALALEWFPDQFAGVPDTIMKMEPQMVGWSIPVAFVIAVSVGVIFGVYPARAAARLDPIEALRHE